MLNNAMELFCPVGILPFALLRLVVFSELLFKGASGVETEFVIDQIETTQDVHVKPGKLAPGLSGSFEIVINPENTDVSWCKCI